MTSRREFLNQTAAGLLAASIAPVAEAVENEVANAASKNLG